MTYYSKAKKDSNVCNVLSEIYCRTKSCFGTLQSVNDADYSKYLALQQLPGMVVAKNYILLIQCALFFSSSMHNVETNLSFTENSISITTTCIV